MATFLIAIALVPALDALSTGIQGTKIHADSLRDYHQLMSKAEEVLATPYGKLLTAAQLAGSNTVATSYSDPGGTVNRRLVYLARYDGDADPFVVLDPNADGDSNPFTGYVGLLWVQVRVEGSHQALTSLTLP